MRLETAQPKHLLIGLTIIQAGRVVGIAPFREPNPALELWARTGEPKRTTALLFAAESVNKTPPTVPVAERTVQGRRQ